jgi:hypothetical protein
MSGAQLDRAVLTGADLRKANLRGAGLRDARLDGADLRDARLGSAFLVGASGARIYDWQSSTARICQMPIWIMPKASCEQLLP